MISALIGSVIMSAVTVAMLIAINYTDKALLIMKDFSDNDLINYLSKISDEDLYAYNVYQIEGEGRKLFQEIKGDEDTIMGLPIKKIKEYLELIK